MGQLLGTFRLNLSRSDKAGYTRTIHVIMDYMPVHMPTPSQSAPNSSRRKPKGFRVTRSHLSTHATTVQALNHDPLLRKIDLRLRFRAERHEPIVWRNHDPFAPTHRCLGKFSYSALAKSPEWMASMMARVSWRIATTGALVDALSLSIYLSIFIVF